MLALAADALAAPGGAPLGSALLAALLAADAAAFLPAALAVALAAPGGRVGRQTLDLLSDTGAGWGAGGGGSGSGGRSGPGEGEAPGGSRGAALRALLALVQAVELPLAVAMDALVQVPLLQAPACARLCCVRAAASRVGQLLCVQHYHSMTHTTKARPTLSRTCSAAYMVTQSHSAPCGHARAGY